MSNATLKASESEFVFNGINGATGEYLTAPMSAQQVAAIALKDPAFPTNSAAQDPTARHFRELNIKQRLNSVEFFGTRFGVAMDKLEEAGWGVLFAQGTDPQIVQALRPLLDLRKDQAGRYYKEYVGASGYAPNDTKDQFLSRNGMGPGPADPEKVPYYLLIVGDPETIPYGFQYQFDVQYAIGRIWFDTLDEYSRYANSVVLAETGKIVLPRKAVLFGPKNPGDRATALSADQLVVPLADRARIQGSAGQWEVESVVGEAATRSRLGEYLGGAKTPALLFTASHGMGFPLGDARQPVHQGGLLCQDWPGPTAGRVDRDHYFAAEDVPDSARVAGLISFHFACYGAGTPRLDDFAHQQLRSPTAIAPRAFVAPLPRRLLSHPSGGALAVIGHVERAWGCSIVWPDAGRQIQAFEDALAVLMSGLPIGYALESINQRYADISSALGADLLRIRNGTLQVDDFAIASQWTANNDARSYVVIGDPAVRLPIAAAGKSGTPRPNFGSMIVPQSIPTPRTEVPLTDTTLATQGAIPSQDITVNTPVPKAAPSTEPASITVTLPLQITISVALGGQAITGAAVLQAESVLQPALTETDAFAIQIDPDYTTREGYDPGFLGSGTWRVPLPRLSPAQLADAAVVSGQSGADQYELRYHHYSVVLNARRRLAFFTAVNIDGKSADRPKREKDKWSFDPRVPRTAQLGDELYANNPFDRGHLVRRLDPAWGRTAAIIKRANDDTFHFTNCSPQHERFNQGKNLWAGLEDYLLDKAADEERKMTVFTGPVFAASDPLYGDVRIPKQYWKVAVIARSNAPLAALGFLVDQERLLHEFITFSPEDVATTFQVPISHIEELTGLSFGVLSHADTGSVDSFAVGQPIRRTLSSYDDISLPMRSTAASVTAFETSAVSEVARASEAVDGTALRYYLVAYDENGRERTDHPAGLISRILDQAISDPTITDVIIFSHGWQGDVPGARKQYSGWIRAMAANDADRARVREVRPGFKPLLVGIHWPSQAWGDENLAPPSFASDAGAGEDIGGVAFALGEESSAAAVEAYASRLGDTPEFRERIRIPLRAVLETAAAISSETNVLPPDLRDAYRQLDAAIGLGSQGVGGNPSADREPFDPEAVYQAARAESSGGSGGVVAFGGFFSKGTLLAPLRALTYWKMKDRARKIGEGAVHDLLVRLQQGAAGRNVRFHLVGHSFGCIVATAAITGPNGAAPVPQSVQSLTLLQGALSLWSYCGDIPYLQGTPGYFHRLMGQQIVRGPIITTRSKYDTAVGTWYPLSSQASGSVAFDAPGSYPKYGGIGAFGIQGGDLNIVSLKMTDIDNAYSLGGLGTITNVEASEFIRNGGGLSGAHNDIRNPQVAHLVWAAIIG